MKPISAKTILIFCVLAIIFFLDPASAGQNDTAGVTMEVPSICKLTINDADQIINLLQDASGEEAYEAGYVDGDAGKPSLVVDSNTNWKLSVAVSIDWSMVESYQKPTGDIQMKVTSNTGHQTGFSDFTPLSLDEQEIASFSGGVGDNIYNCQYRILLDWAKDIPGVYVIILSYTLSTQSL